MHVIKVENRFRVPELLFLKIYCLFHSYVDSMAIRSDCISTRYSYLLSYVLNGKHSKD